MNNLEWINDIQWQDLSTPLENVEGEEIYTVYFLDFLKMPALNFVDLADLDPTIGALFN